MMFRSKNLKILFLISNPNIFDHALALFNQISKLGVHVRFLLPRDVTLPERYRHLETFVLRGFSRYLARRYEYIWIQVPYRELWDPLWKDLIDGKHIIYSGYGLVMDDSDKFHYGLEFYKSCSTIMIQNMDMYSKFISMGINEESLLFTGDPLKYEIQNSSIDNFSDEKYDLVWMPHWTFTWVDGRKGFARWPEMFEGILSFAKSNPEFKILIRAHPLMDNPNIVESGFKWSNVKHKLMSESNITFSNNSLIDDIFSCKFLITDGVTPIAYFGMLGKPVCYFKGAGEFGPFNENGLKIVKTTNVASSSDEILGWIKDIRSVNPIGENLALTINGIFPSFSDSPGQLLVNHLCDLESF